MTQRERIISLLEFKKFITNEDLNNMGLLHVGRNRITEAETKAYFLDKGYEIVYVNSPDFIKHRWELKPVEVQVVFTKNGQGEFAASGFTEMWK